MGKDFTERSVVVCVINGGTTTKYFSLGRGARQDDPNSGFLFVLALEISFLFIKAKPEIEEICIIFLQCSWIRRLYDNSFHEWKLIPLY